MTTPTQEQTLETRPPWFTNEVFDRIQARFPGFVDFYKSVAEDYDCDHYEPEEVAGWTLDTEERREIDINFDDSISYLRSAADSLESYRDEYRAEVQRQFDETLES